MEGNASAAATFLVYLALDLAYGMLNSATNYKKREGGTGGVWTRRKTGERMQEKEKKKNDI